MSSTSTTLRKYEWARAHIHTHIHTELNILVLFHNPYPFLISRAKEKHVGLTTTLEFFKVFWAKKMDDNNDKVRRALDI